jgi:polyhydroxyalkanoate synthase subunit PhaC
MTMQENTANGSMRPEANPQSTPTVPPPRLVPAQLKPHEPPSYAATTFGDTLDRSVHAAAARFTGGLSPAAIIEANMDWLTHLATSPGKQLQLVETTFRKALQLLNHTSECALRRGSTNPCVEPLPQDRRFTAAAWQEWPYNVIHQTFLLQQEWWHHATTGVRGVTQQHENAVEFMSRQILDMMSPSNFLLTNPEATQRTIEDGGMNLQRGAQNAIQDWQRAASGQMPAGAEAFKVGRDVAITPGKVIYRNRLIELIQYDPATPTVHPEPVLIVPAWIMKYYILDLSPHNSLVKYLSGQGFTVFMISWKNPGPEDRDLSLEDYRELGVMAALDAVTAVNPETPVHAVGYCIGGTLLSIAAAAMARQHDTRLRSITLLAAQTDFHEAGELMLFINESQLSFLDDMMWERGFLDTKQMAGAFQLLRSNDLIWSRMVRHYLMGERTPIIDLLAWNADATRMPYRMHSEYLRRLFLANDLAEGKYLVGNRPIAMGDIRVPMFVVGTTRDHVAPWRSVHKIHLLTDTDVTFLLTTGGHNAGIVSEPGATQRTYQVLTKRGADHYVDPDSWIAKAAHKAGSWWPEWAAWLATHSGAPVAPPPMSKSLGDAPGTYVCQP